MNMKMDCDQWQEKLDAFVDNELSLAETRAYQEHIYSCPACAAETVARQRLKIETRAAGQAFLPDPEFEARIAKRFEPRSSMRWNLVPTFAMAALAVVVIFIGWNWHRAELKQEMVAQLVDQHVALLASGQPLEFASADPHAAKPWFAGKVPFSIDVPDLRNTPYQLVGGRIAYFQQSPAAQLVFQARKHTVSVFILRDRGLSAELGEETTPVRRSGLTSMTWSEDGVRYFAVSDAPADDVRRLCDLLKEAS